MASTVDVHSLQGNRCRHRTPQDNLWWRWSREMTKLKAPNRAEVLLPLAVAVVCVTKAYQETPNPYSTRASWPPCLHSKAWEVSYHCPAIYVAGPHNTLPQEEL